MDFSQFAHAFVPIFVAVDAFGLLPLYVGLVEGLETRLRRRILNEAILTALCIMVAFVFFGKTLFDFMGISAEDFQIAGGLLLFVISTMDLISGFKITRRVTDTVGVVPLGTPLIAGPAVLTTSLILRDSVGLGPTLLSLVVNVALTWIILLSADLFTRLMGHAGSKAVSKVANLILAGFAVMMVRHGVVALIQGLGR